MVVGVGLSGVVVMIRYKTPDDKPLNAFGFGEKALDKKHALEVRTTAIDQHGRPLTAPGPISTLTPPWLAGWLVAGDRGDARLLEGPAVRQGARRQTLEGLSRTETASRRAGRQQKAEA